MKIQELNIYPLKSARAQNVKEMKMTSQGPEGDREWVLIDENGKFISQRTLPKLATVEVFQDESALTVGLGKMFFKVSRKNNFQRKVQVQIWNDTIEAALEPDLYSQGISQYLGVNCRLVRFAPFSARPMKSLDPAWQPEIRFSDRRPLQILNTKSLEDLNSRLPAPIGADRFRANIIFAGEEAFAEDHWKRIQIGPVIFSQPKKCARCTMTTIDQQTGISTGKEPLATLAKYRREDSQVFFGSLWIPENAGSIRLDDKVQVLE